MDRAAWESWRKAKGKAKDRLRDKLVQGEEQLARAYAMGFARHSNLPLESLIDDLTQAARIGIMRALPAWEPDKGAFNNVAFFWARHEMQAVVRDVNVVSVPKTAFIPRKKQQEAERFATMHGRQPRPEEIGLTPADIDRAAKAAATCERESSQAAEDLPDGSAPDLDAMIDRKRDVERLRAFVATLKPRERQEFWAGTRPDLAEKAKAYVEGHRR